jgi:Zn-dependent protease with chaperone function
MPATLRVLDLHAPGNFPSPIAWFVHGVVTHRRACLVAWACGWLNLALAVGLGVLFALGGLLGGLLTPLLADVALLHGLGAEPWAGISALTGLITGAVAGFLIGLALPWILAGAPGGFGLSTGGFHGIDWQRIVAELLIQVLVGAGLALVLTWGSILFEPWLMRLRGYRRMSRRERERILPLAERCAERLGLPNLPVVLMSDAPLPPNAHAYCRHIVILRSLYKMLEGDDEALGGVIGHELTHWANADPVGGIFVWSLAFPVTFLWGLLQRIAFASPNQLIRAIAYILLYPLPILVRLVIAPVLSRETRRFEYRCDGGAARAGFRQGMYRVLGTIQDFEPGATQWQEVVARSHPPIELRMEQLERDRSGDPIPRYRTAG